MRTLPPLALAAPLPLAAAAPGCDTFWNALAHAPLDGRAARAKGEAEALRRYRSGAMAPAQGISAEEFSGQPKPARMAVAPGLTLGDRVMTCYAEDAAERDAAHVTKTETELPPAIRAGRVARFRTKD